jgi:hypothetical protein
MEGLPSIISKLINNASVRSKSVASSSQGAIARLCSAHPKVAFQVVDRLFDKPTRPLPQETVLVCSSIFIKTFSSVEVSTALPVFLQFQSWFLAHKPPLLFSTWDKLCETFITSAEIAKEVWKVPLNTPIGLITYWHVAKFVADDVLAKFAASRTSIVAVSPEYFVKFITVLADNASSCSQFLATAFTWVYQFFMERPSVDAVRALIKILQSFKDMACPTCSRQVVAKICDQTFSEDVLVPVFELLVLLCYDKDLVKRTVELVVAVLGTINAKETLDVGDRSRFPVDVIEPSHGPHTKPVVRAALGCLGTLSQTNLDTVVQVLLSGTTKLSRYVGFDSLRLLLKRHEFSDGQKNATFKAIRRILATRNYESGLSELTVQLLQSFSLSEEDVAFLISYIADAALAMGNSHYFLHLGGVRDSYLEVILNKLCEFMFDQSKMTLLSSLSQALNLILIRRIGEGQTYFLHESLDEAGESQRNRVLHPLVPVLMKRSIADKALYLLRVLSCLMAHGPLHPFVPSMLENLKIFLDFVAPMAFSEIQTTLESVSRSISTSSEFPSLLMSLLSNIMRLLNDQQFRIALCGSVIREVEANIHPKHTQNSLKIFGEIVPFLPVEVTSADIQRLFSVLQFEDQTVSSAFSELLGTISASNPDLVLPFFKAWTTMKANSEFLIGKSKSPIPYQFIGKTLVTVSRDVPTECLLKVANSDLFALLGIMTRRGDVQPAVVLSALSQLSTRLAFQRATFALQNFDEMFNSVVKIVTTPKLRAISDQSMAALRLLSQVAPCLTKAHLNVLYEKIISYQYLSACIPEAKLFVEYRGLLLGILCVIPETEVLVSFLRLLMPFIDNQEVLPLVQQLLSLFESYVREDAGSVKFFKPIKTGTIPILPRLLVDLLSAKDVDTGFKAAVSAMRIDRAPTASYSSIHDILAAVSDSERAAMANVTLECLAKGRDYSFLLAEQMKYNGQCVQVEKLIGDVFGGKVPACFELVKLLVIKNAAVIFKWLLAARMSDVPLTILAKSFKAAECIEILVQQFIVVLLDIPDDKLVIDRLLLFVDRLLVGEVQIAQKVVFQMICALIVFGLATRAFDTLGSLFAEQVKTIAIVKKYERPVQNAHFEQVWGKTVARLSNKGVDDLESVIGKMLQANESLLADVMNFLLANCQLTKPIVSTAISIFAGEVLLQTALYTASNALFQLFISRLLSFGPLFDPFICICCLNGLFRIFSRPDINSESFPEQYLGRVLPIVLKSSSAEAAEVIECVSLCATQFCTVFGNILNDKLNDHIFGIIVALLKRDIIAGAVGILNILKKSQIPDAFVAKYRLLHRLIAFYRQSGIDVNPEEKFDGPDVGEILNVFVTSQVVWMICAALEFLRTVRPDLVPTFEEQVTELLDSSSDEVLGAVEGVIPLAFIQEA